MKDVDTELRARGEDARRALLQLYSSPKHAGAIASGKKDAWCCASRQLGR